MEIKEIQMKQKELKTEEIKALIAAKEKKVQNLQTELGNLKKKLEKLQG